MVKVKTSCMRHVGGRGLVLALFGLLMMFTPQNVYADDTIEIVTDFIVFCTSAGQLCDPPFSETVETGSVLQARYIVLDHCSSLKVHIFVDGVLEVTTGFLGWAGAPAPFNALPLDSSLLDLGPVSPGAHLISVQAEGQVSGCNVGGLGAWGGRLKVVTSPIKAVDIDTKPGSDPNSINCNNEKGVIPVAILTTADFDATTVDHTTVTFEGAGETHVNKKSGEPRRHEEDVDGDGDTDLVLHFRLGDTSLTCSSNEGVLRGETFDGHAIVGSDDIRMIDKS